VFEPKQLISTKTTAANGNPVGVRDGIPVVKALEGLPLQTSQTKKDPEREPGVSSPDGYSGGKGGAAQLKYTRH
jgi:hypothetical protein